jgi:glycosyltransferase involved in cell wall biosynthesis
MKSIKLSVVIITFNEEHNIRRCLDSIKDVADEIIVLDSYSSDKTAEICRLYNADFVQHKFEGHVEQKNAALDLATNDYVLSLDADEALSAQLLTSIQEVKNDCKYQAYIFNRLTFYGAKPIKTCGWYPDQKIRLWNKNLGAWGGINPHDKVIIDNPTKVKHLKGDLLHYSFTDFWDYVNRSTKYAKISGEAYHKAGEKFRFYNLIINPVYRFVRDYIFKFGFIEGYVGLMICSVASFTVFLKYYTFFLIKHQYKTTSADIQYKPTVLHFSSEQGWRGGEQQIAYLIDELKGLNVKSFVACRAGSEFEKHCKKNSIEFISLPFKSSYELGTALQIKKICKYIGVDILHMHSSRGHSIGVISSLLGNKSKLVLSRRVDFPVKNNLFSRWKYNFSKIERIICVSDKIKDIITPFITKASKIRVSHSGIDMKRFSHTVNTNILHNAYGLDSKTKIVANISALAEHKDYFTFIDAVEEFKKLGNHHVKFFIIGEGELRFKIESYIFDRHLEDDIILTGFRKDIPDILPEIDVFLMTSKEEGLGTTVLDAFANKVPVVATAGGGIPEMVIHEKTGLLYAIKDAKGLAQGVDSILSDSALSKTLTDGAYARLQDNFTKEKMAHKTYDIYQEVLALT